MESSPSIGEPFCDLKKFSCFGQFLYTQNPFYLISCGFVMCGLHVVASRVGDQYSRANFLTTSLAMYVMLMALTAIAVIRFAKVWDDARSILLIVMIGQVAYSIAVDELCLNDPQQAAVFLLTGAAGTFLITELVLLCCRIRFAFGYRCAYYAMLGVFYAAPILASHFRSAHSEVANWSAILFSIAAGGSVLLLIPAVHRGGDMSKNNGTPWNWPLFPLSAFVVMLVLAGFRSHAIWMAFGSLRGEVTFQPLLLLPLILAVGTLALEDAISREKHTRVAMIIKGMPVLAVCGISGLDSSSILDPNDSFNAGLRAWGGSTMTIALGMIVLMYAYAVARRVDGAIVGLSTGLFAMAVFGNVPTVLGERGVEIWMLSVVACVIWLFRCLRRDASEWSWMGLTVMSCATIWMAQPDQTSLELAFGLPAVWAFLMLMFIGWRFDTVLAYQIRCWLAIGGVVAASTSVTYHFAIRSIDSLGWILFAASALAALYAVAVRRTGWLSFASGLCIAALVITPSLPADPTSLTAIAHDDWQLMTGALCFLVGVAITSSKTNRYRRLRTRMRKRRERSSWVRGF